MTQYLPPNLLALFAPRDPIPYLPPVDKLPHEKKTKGYLGIGAFLNHFEDPKDTPPPTRVETREERLERRRKEKQEQVAYKLEREIAIWDPHKIKVCTEDPFKTLFVARINYDTSESKLRREFEVYGPIKKIILLHNLDTNKPRGYAFIEYEHERDMHSAYKHADGKKIDGKRVLVDVERARTVKGWLPRRLGGGLGGTRRGGPDVNIKHSGREDNERERKRYLMEREREDRRPDFRDRDRFNDRRRSRSPIRDRMMDHRRERSRHRSRSRDRTKKRRSRERDIDERGGGGGGGSGSGSIGIGIGGVLVERRERDRDRERGSGGGGAGVGVGGDKDKERKRKRSRSRERDRSERKRDKRDKDREKEKKERKPEFRETDIKIKEEPYDDYPDYSTNFANYSGVDVKYEDDEKKYKPFEQDMIGLGNKNRNDNGNMEEGEYDDRGY